jgi:hypothetical protein
MELVDGGIMENVSVSNLVIEGPQVPLFVRLGNRARKFTTEAPAPPVGRMNNIRISNIIAKGGDETGCSFTGLANAPIENIFLNDIYIESSGGGKGTDTLRRIEEMETVYPEATMFGPLPSYGFYIRHAKGVTLSNITLTYKGTDTRPGMAVVDAERFSFSGLHIQSEGKTEKVVYEKVTFDNPVEPAIKKSSKRK